MSVRLITSGLMEKVDIELYRKSAFQFKLAEGKNNDGLFYWEISETINLSVNYRIKIINHNNIRGYNFCESFQIQD